MKPIPTANAMKPAPGKGISSFPTPVIKDTVIVEIVNAWSGSYTPLEYGTKWDDVPHASVQGSFPDHKLINQSPNSEDGQWVKRIWANDRVDQDTYNYAIKYSGGSDAHPIYIRTYVELRETYAPVPDLSPDPLFPGAFLVEEEVQRQEDELDSRYVKVIRTYETLNGPIISSQRYNDRGDIETVNVQQVFPSTLPDPDGLLVTQSQVIKEDVSKGTKTTATVPSHSQLLIKENKEGLLGETATTDNIVDPSTQPDALSQSVVASVVQQTSATKAVKRTTTSTGPTSFSSRSNKQGLLGRTTISESIVQAGSTADQLTLNVISSEVSQIDSAKSKKTTITSNGPTTLSSDSLVDSPLGLVSADVVKSIVAPTTQPEGSLQTIRDNIDRLDEAKSEREKVSINGNWPTNSGVDYDEQLGLGIYYEETIVSPSEYINPEYWADLSNTTYRPLDQWKSLRRKIDKKKISQGLLEQWYKISTTAQIELPDKLLEIKVYWGKSYGAGKGWTTDEDVGEGSYGLSLSGSSRNSASIDGDIYFNLEKGFSGAIPAYEHTFFMEIGQDGKVQADEVLSILNNFEEFGERGLPSGFSGQTSGKYKLWPRIKNRSENIVVITGGKSETFNKSKSEYANINGYGSATGCGSSLDVNVNARSINIPAALHRDLTIFQESIGEIPASIPPPEDEDGTCEFESTNMIPTHGVRPEKLEWTKIVLNGEETDAENFPVGDYLYSTNIELYKWGFVKVTAITVSITSDYI